MPNQPTILVTRRLPDNVLARVRRDYDARINLEDKLYDADEIIRRAEGCAGLLICSTEKLPAAQLARLPAAVKVVATFSVGYEHIDIEAAKTDVVIERPIAGGRGGAGKVERTQPCRGDRRADDLDHIGIAALVRHFDLGRERRDVDGVIGKRPQRRPDVGGRKRR